MAPCLGIAGHQKRSLLRVHLKHDRTGHPLDELQAVATGLELVGNRLFGALIEAQASQLGRRLAERSRVMSGGKA